MNKRNYIILTIFLFFSAVFVSFPLRIEAEIYTCHKCVSGVCKTDISTEPCPDNCSGCQTTTCKVCSGGKCVSKTFQGSCSDACTGDSACQSNSCNTCNSSNQCVIKSYASYCTDECTGAENCGGTTSTTKEDDKESAWHCNTVTETCYWAKKSSRGYDKLEQCEANCIYCRVCDEKYFGWFGPWGCYGITSCTDNIDKCTTNADCNGGTTTSKYSCNTSSGCVQDNTNGTYTTSNCDGRCVKRCVGTSCQYNDNTSNSTCTYSSQCSNVNRYRCSSTSGCIASSSGGYTTSNCDGRCVKRCVGTSCQYNDNTSNSTCTSNANCVGSPPTTEPPLANCMIYTFDLPDRAWVGYPITGSWSTNEDCIYGDVTCSSNTGGECYWQDDNLIPIGGGEHPFTIGQAGEYTYTFTAYGESGSDQRDIETKIIPAYNLPWWREIIPVLPDLQGFLKGIWG